MRSTPLLRNVRPSPTISAALKQRVRHPAFLQRLTRAEDLAPLFKNDDYIGWSGFTGVGYPKTVPTAIADHIEQNNLQADTAMKKRSKPVVGASVGAEVEDRWACLHIIAWRYPQQVGKDVAKGNQCGKN